MRNMLVDEHAYAYSALKKGPQGVVCDNLSDGLNNGCGKFDAAAVISGARNDFKVNLMSDHPCKTVLPVLPTN